MLVLVGILALGTPWSETTIRCDDDWSYSPNFEQSTMYTPSTNDALSEPKPDPFVKGSSCSCSNNVLAWKHQELTEQEENKMKGIFTDDDDLTPSAPQQGRCNAVSTGWGFQITPIGTIAPGLAMAPGTTKQAILAGDAKIFLKSAATSRGEPCGIVTQDVFQATLVDTEGTSANLIPSSVPSSLYCELDGSMPFANDTATTYVGSAAEASWKNTFVSTLSTIDAVCRCSLGRVPAMLEHSGVYFTNPDYYNMNVGAFGFGDAIFLQNRSDAVNSTHGFLEAKSYHVPNVFYCREDYVVYWELLYAFKSIYGTTGFLRNVFIATRSITYSLTGDDYYIRFHVAGVDCQRAISSADSACDNTPNLMPPLLPNVTVGLDIGQLFAVFNLPAICGVDTEDDINATDPSYCVRNFLWDIASMQRLNISDPCSMNSTWGLCANKSHLSSGKNGSMLIYTKSAVDHESVQMWPPTGDPTANIVQYIIETAALYVRLASYTNISIDVLELHDQDDPFYTPLTKSGTDCTVDMISGQTRVVEDPDPENLPAVCPVGSNPEYAHCPGVTSTRKWFFHHGNAYKSVFGGVCCGAQTLQNRTCCFDQRNSNGGATECGFPYDNRDLGGNGNITITQCQGCGNQQPSYVNCYGPDGNGPRDPTNNQLCSSGDGSYGDGHNHLGDFTVCAADQNNDPCIRYCGSLREDCVGDLGTMEFVKNYVGGIYPPVTGWPMMRGMAPRYLYNGTLQSNCTAFSYLSTLYNTCVATLPRPPVASIFAQGVTNSVNLLYTASFYDVDYQFLFKPNATILATSDEEEELAYFPFLYGYPGTGDYPWRHVFNSAGAMYGNPGASPTVSDIILWCAKNPTPLVCTNTARFNNRTLYSANAFTTTEIHDFQVAVNGKNTKSGIGSNTELPTVVAGLSFAKSMTEVYQGLRVQRPGAISNWATAVLWAGLDFDSVKLYPSWNTLVSSMPEWTPGLEMTTSEAYFATIGITTYDIIDVMPGFANLRNGELSDNENAALNTLTTRTGCVDYSGFTYCAGGCFNYRAVTGVPFYMFGKWCGSLDILPFDWYRCVYPTPFVSCHIMYLVSKMSVYIWHQYALSVPVLAEIETCVLEPHQYDPVTLSIGIVIAVVLCVVSCRSELEMLISIMIGGVLYSTEIYCLWCIGLKD
jgi:hypothetical protein